MANSATAGAAPIPIKAGYYNAITRVVITMDTVQSDLTLLAAQANKHIGIVGGFLQNNHASGAQTILFKSGTVEIARRVIAAAGIWELGTRSTPSLSPTPLIITDVNSLLAVRLNDATNQPINGVLYLAYFDTNTGIPVDGYTRN